MFTESFENSSKQQARRASRMEAMRRMEEAAAGLVHANQTSDSARKREATPVTNAKPSGRGTTEGSFVGDFPASKGHPWNDADDAEHVDDYSYNPAGHSSAASVSSASKFLRETQRQHELEHPTSPGNSPKAPPALTQSGRLKLSSAAKQFLWDENSVASGYTQRSTNLHDIKHSLSQRGENYARNKGQGKRGARWSAINDNGNIGKGLGEGIWNALTGAGGTNGDEHSVASSRSGWSSRYRDEEGERLLTMASERLGGGNPVVENLGVLNEESKEYGEIEEDDDSFTRRRVFLDAEGQMTYDNTNYNADDVGDLHARRMMNSYKRGLKRPAMLLCTVAAIVGVCFGAVEMYSKMMGGVTNVDGGDGESYGDWKEGVSVSDGGDWGDNVGMGVGDQAGGAGAAAEDGTDAAPNRDAPMDQKRFDHIRYKLINAGASPAKVMRDESSAEYAAMVWLTRDDPRQMDPESVYLAQRYGLAVLWFGTSGGGYGWHVPGEQGAEDEPVEEGDESDAEDEYENRRNLKEADPQLWFNHEGWLSSAGVCGWHGVKCHPRENGDTHDPNNDGDISHLELRRNNLQGLIPEELYATMPYLKVLDLSDNGLAGVISDDIGKLNKLESLNLTSNNVAGSLTDSIGDLASLKELYLANNILGDSIPHSIGKLQKLRHLNFSGNSLRGTLPYQIGQLKQLSSLDLSFNLLAGPIPHEFSELQTLVELDVSHNDLGGPLFSELGYVTYLTALRLNDNHFGGEVPKEIGNLIHLDELRLDSNEFEGSLPAEISHLDGLDILNVANNKFKGSFPPEWTEMAGLRELDVSSNMLQGRIPIFIDGMKNLRSLNMAHNDLSDSIPSEIGRLYKLEYLYLDNNEFEGSVPTELGELANLKKMALHNNDLIGDVDAKICKLADELFLTQLSVDCGGETPEVYCDCCLCHDHEPIVHLVDEEP